MTLSDLASLGSFISGIAVLISLIYLSIQVRHNVALLERSENNATQTQASITRNALINSRDVARLWVEGRKDDSTLDEVDEIRFSAMVAERFWSSYQVWDRDQRGILNTGTWERTTPGLISLLRTRRGAICFELNKSAALPEFVRDIDGLIAAQQATLPKAK